jgi:trans-aconitate methyltransferase
VSKDYNKFIHRAVPRYPEMLWAIFQYIPKDLKPKRILELGCGTGNLSELIVKTYPNAEKVLVDISEKVTGWRIMIELSIVRRILMNWIFQRTRSISLSPVLQSTILIIMRKSCSLGKHLTGLQMKPCSPIAINLPV